MSFRIEHENSPKNLRVDSIDNPIDDIKFIKKESQYNIFKNPEQEIDDTEEIGLDFITNEQKRNEPDFNDIEEDEEENRFDNNNDNTSDIMMQGKYSASDYDDEDQREPVLSYEETQQQKAYFLSQLKRLGDKGHISSRRFGPEHSLNEIKSEVLRIRKEIEINRGVNYCRQGLMFCVSTIEMLNNKYDPFSVDLDGWSNVIMADKEAYDDVFEELYEKYSSKIAMAPEIKLISMVAGSAMMFHLQKSLMNNQFNKGGGGSLFNSLASKLGNMGQEDTNTNTQKKSDAKMKGPSIDTDELLRKLNSDDFSDVSSVSGKTSELNYEGEEKTISLPQPKKRGRKPKNSR